MYMLLTIYIFAIYFINSKHNPGLLMLINSYNDQKVKNSDSIMHVNIVNRRKISLTGLKEAINFSYAVNRKNAGYCIDHHI